ncbi:MAG: RimK family alpha-L-glutamate ligase [Gaiellaceae bacterium]
MPVVALATCAEVPEGDDEAPALVAALVDHGITAVSAVWDSPDEDWSRFDLVVVRSTWDYPERRDTFLAWAAALPRVLNPPDVLRWNTDKRYLAELADAGVPVVPTQFVEPGEPFSPPSGRVVVKPAVSAGSRHTASHSDPVQTAEHVERLQGMGRTTMVQPYVGGVDAEGETALIYLGGRYSHTVRKAALLADEQPPGEDLYLEETIDAREPSGEELAAGQRAVAALPFDATSLLYARVDLLPTSDGPVVLEVELTEPSLFLGYAAGAAERLADAIVRVVSR